MKKILKKILKPFIYVKNRIWREINIFQETAKLCEDIGKNLEKIADIIAESRKDVNKIKEKITRSDLT